MRINTLPAKLREALEIKEAFDRFTTGQATLADRKLVKEQNLRWVWISRKHASLGNIAQQQMQQRRAKLPYLISMAEKQHNLYKKASLLAEYYNLYG